MLVFICVVDVFMGAYVIYFEIKCHHIAAVEITNDFMLFFGAELLWCCCQGSQSVFLTLVIVACFLCLIFRVELRLYCCQDSQSLLTLDLVKYLCVIFNEFWGWSTYHHNMASAQYVQSTRRILVSTLFSSVRNVCNFNTW